jgi:ComF family protein
MRRWQRALLAALFPQRTACHACGAPLMKADGVLCPACAASLRAHTVPPARLETVVDVHIAVAAAPFVYDGAPAALVKALKFGGDHTAALPLAQGMAAAYAALAPLRDAVLCVPVPVHYRRLRRRGYNQAEVLAEAFCELAGLRPPVAALVRVHHKHSQVGMGHTARRMNIAGAFAVSTAGERVVRGRAVLLVDDVLTTGSTAAECAQVLAAAGAEVVMLLTACRV